MEYMHGGQWFLVSYGPEFQLKPGKFACNVHREPARPLELFPYLASALKLEVAVSRMKGYLPRSNRQGVQGYARQCQIDQIPDAFDRSDFDLRGKTGPKCFCGQLSADRKDEVRVLEQFPI